MDALTKFKNKIIENQKELAKLHRDLFSPTGGFTMTEKLDENKIAMIKRFKRGRIKRLYLDNDLLLDVYRMLLKS